MSESLKRVVTLEHPLASESLHESLKKEVLQGLQPLFVEARANGLWFYCSGYWDIWFSPDELEAMHMEDRFLWGAVNWELRNPREGLERLNSRVAVVEAERARFAARIQGSSVPNVAPCLPNEAAEGMVL